MLTAATVHVHPPGNFICQKRVSIAVSAYTSHSFISVQPIQRIMPESNAAAKRRIQKQNRANGIGDEQGRIVRVKDPPKMVKCTVCQMEMKITKTNTELTAHATSKHGKTLEECFPGAKETAEEMIAALQKGKSGGSGDGGGMSKAQRKAKDAAGLDDLLNAGLAAGKKKGKK